MSRRRAELAVIQGGAGAKTSASSLAEAELRELERLITSNDAPPSALLQEVVERIGALTRSSGAAIALRDEWGVICRASTGEAPDVGSRLRADSALTRECLEDGHVVICEDAETDYRVRSSTARTLRLRSAVVVPLRSRGSVLGVIEILSSRPFAYSPAEIAGLQRVAALLTPALFPEPLHARESGEKVVALPPTGSEKPKAKLTTSLVIGAILLLLLALLFMAKPRYKQAGSFPARVVAPAPPRKPAQQERTQTAQPAISGETSRPSENSLRPEISAEAGSASRPRSASQPNAAATSTLRKKSETIETPAASSKENSIAATKMEPIEPPALNAGLRPPVLPLSPAAPVILTRLPPPDFLLDRTLKGHTGWVTGVAFSPDGQRLASGSWDQTLKFWEVSTGEQLSTVGRKMKEVQAIAFSSDGRWLATENSANSVSLRDAVTGQEIRTLPSDRPLGPLGSNWVYSIAFSPDGKWLASGIDDKTVRLWDVNTGRKVRDLATLRRPVIYVAFSPDGRLLASGDDDKTIRIWNLSSGQEVQKLSGHRKPIFAVAFSPDGRWLASASADKTIKLWDVASGREVHTLTGHGNVVTTLAFSPDGRWLVSGSWDKTIKIWEVNTGRQIQTLGGHDHPVYSVAFDSRGQWLASGSEDGTIRLWHLAENGDQSRPPR